MVTCAVLLVIVMGMVDSSETTSQACITGHLGPENPLSHTVLTEEAVSLQLRPQQADKKLSLQLLLQNNTGQQLYGLGFDANLGVQWGDVEVALKDTPTSNNILKVTWPPILLAHAWTTFYIHVKHQQLLQLAIIPHEAMKNPRSLSTYDLDPMPLAASVKLDRKGVTTMQLKLLTKNTAAEYTINCGHEYMATSFSAEFGIRSSVSVWRTTVWILLGIIIVLVGLCSTLLTKLCHDIKKKSPTSFTLAHFRPGSHSKGGPIVLVSSSQGGRPSAAPNNTADKETQLPRITVGVVSSRAPSPGHEVDENTFDYINRAFTAED